MASKYPNKVDEKTSCIRRDVPADVTPPPKKSKKSLNEKLCLKKTKPCSKSVQPKRFFYASRPIIQGIYTPPPARPPPYIIFTATSFNPNI